MNYFFMAQQPPVSQAILVINASRSQAEAPHSVGLLWMNDSPTKRPIPDSSQHSKETDVHAPGGIQTSSPTKRVTTDPRLRQLGHWDRRDGT